jgi:hypothetical protein
MIQEEKYVLICGTRNTLRNDQKDIIKKEIEHINNLYKDNHLVLIHGDCTGVDKYGEEIAKSLGWRVIPVPAQWSRYGRGAGPIRNQVMVDTYRPHIFISFPAPDSKGTFDCIRRVETYKKGLTSRLVYSKQVYLY